MSIFTDREFSISNGDPIRLYEFKMADMYGASARHWYYTNADKDFGDYEIRYAAIPICDDGIRQTGQAVADTLTITTQDDLPLVKLLAWGGITCETWVTIRDTHWKTYYWDNKLVVWVGTVASIKFGKPGEVDIVCNSLSASMGRMGLRQTYQRNCPHSIYDSSCRINLFSQMDYAEIVALDGATITLDILPDKYYVGGFVICMDWEGFMYSRGIESRDGNALTLLGGTSGLKVGEQVMIFPGCNQTAEMCHMVYDNLLNFGGIRHMPGQSPFEAMIFYE